jgi:striatin 1/3/4
VYLSLAVVLNINKSNMHQDVGLPPFKLFLCRSASLDVEPLYTFRCHTGPVLCLAMSATGEQCYSGGLDGAIHCWNLPCANIDPYDSFGMYVILNL